MTRTSLPILVWIVFSACSPSGWLTDKPVSYQGSSIYLRPIDTSVVAIRTDALSQPVVARFNRTEADSLLTLLVARTLRIPDARYRDARLVSSYAESDFSIEILGITIKESRNPLHRLVKNGPALVVEVTTEVKRGERTVYRTVTSDVANLAALASTEPGFHKATPEQLNDSALQRATLHKAYYSAVGEMLMSFFQVNRF